VVVAGIRVEIRADTVLQADRFADVDDRPLGILHQITAGLGWEGIENTFDVAGNIHRSNFITPHNTFTIFSRMVNVQFISIHGFLLQP
jgi:hypothetical protein